MRVFCRSTMAALLASLWLASPASAQSPPAGSALKRDAANAALPAARNDLGFVNYVSILDPAFGAKCDGATDDAAAIQAAVNAVPQYGVLLTPTGKTCNFNSTITIQRQISFRSDGGPGGTQFFWGGNATDDHIVVSNRTGPFQAGAVRFVAAPGTGYSASQTITLNDGCAAHAVLTIARVSGGAVADARVTTAGSCVTAPSATAAITQLSSSGGGTGATFMMFYGSSGTKANNVEFHNVTFGSNTTMTAGCAIRADYVYGLQTDNIRIYGNNKVWRGICLSRAITGYIKYTLMDNLLSESVTASGTDNSGNQTSDFFIDYSQLQGCNLAVASKAAALLTGCVHFGDYAGAPVVRHTEIFGSFNGYGVLFDPTASRGGQLAFFDDLNIEASGAWSGALSMTYGSAAIGGGSWLTGNNIDTVSFASGVTGVTISPNATIAASQSDGSTPNAVYVNGQDIGIAGLIIGNYNLLGPVGAGVYLDAASNHVNISSAASIRQFTSGVQGNGAVGTYTLDAVFRSNTADLTGLTCASFVHANAVGSNDANLCGLSAGGGAPTLSACGGGSPSLDATASDTAGVVREGTNATGCTITFHTAFATAPHCVVSGSVTYTHAPATTTALTVANRRGSRDTFTYHCLQ